MEALIGIIIVGCIIGGIMGFVIDIAESRKH